MSGDYFVLGNMAWNAGIVCVAAYFIKRWISTQDNKFDETKKDLGLLRAEAEARGLRLHIKVDDLKDCMTGVKVSVEGKVDRSHCDQIERDRLQALLDHAHACCADKDTRVIL